jgi:hypothetical protein
VYNIPTGTWRVEEYYDTITTLAKFYSGGQDYLYMGASDGEVHKRGKYTDVTFVPTDDGYDITTLFLTGALSFGNPSVKKEFGKIIAYSDRAQGLMLKARVFDNSVSSIMNFNKLVYLKNYITEAQVNPNSGNLLQIEGTESGSKSYYSLFGFSININQDSKFKN